MSLFSLLPEDIFSLLCKSLTPKDVCTLSSCCRSLSALVDSEKVWLVQCESVGIVGWRDLVEWRKGVSSYKTLCKFLHRVKPLVGIWVHQNPELGNVVYAMPGFVSIVGCRVIPQELGALGIQHGPLLWAPVFEIVGDENGSLMLFLHGRESDCNYLYPACLKSIDRNCNILLLEVEPNQTGNRGNNSFVHCSSDRGFTSRVDRGMLRSQSVPEKNSAISFQKLGFGDRRKLLQLAADHVRLNASDLANGLLFPPLRDEDGESSQKDMILMEKRRALLIEVYNFGEGCTNPQDLHQLSSNLTEIEMSKVKKSVDHPGSVHGLVVGNGGRSSRTFASCVKDRVKQMLGRSCSVNASREGLRYGSSSKENRNSKFQEFLGSADTMEITLCAKSVRLLTYRTWPNMHDNQFALYKLSTPLPVAGQEYAGLWGGTFGWPPGIPTGDKPGKALFFLSLSYEEFKGRTVLIATKILEGTHYVLHPNGSAMFEVTVDEMSDEVFPWNTDGVSLPMDVKHAYNGFGIANGYGFRFPGSKPGTLFVIRDGLLAFVWNESRAVLTLQRLNLQELLKKGERVSALPPIVNFAYLTKSYSNVFTGFSNTARSIPKEELAWNIKG